MSETTRHIRIRRYLRVLQKAIQRNLSVTALVSSLAFGGLTLLLYVLSIGLLPEFTWNDLTGTFLAVCATGVVVVAVVVAYCLSAGYFARSALEAVYPEAAHHVPTIPRDAHAKIEPYERLTRPPFIFGATCFSVLAWVALIVGASSEKLIPPHHEHLVGALLLALVALVVLLLLDWQRFRRQWLRYTLLSILSGSIVTLIVIITAWSVGPSSLVAKSLATVSEHGKTTNWAAFWVIALNHVIEIGWGVALCVAVLANFRAIASRIRFSLAGIARLIAWRLPPCLQWAIASTKHAVVGDSSDRRLIRAKVYVTFWFCIFGTAVFFTAYAMAGMGNASDWGWNFFFLVTLLTFLNWASFSVRQWRRRIGLGLVTAALVFLSYPILVRNPILFPKMIVSLLGLGNERVAAIGISSKQCATLAPYGVRCVPDNERTITLTNVNLLTRLGSSVALELLIKDEQAGRNPAPTANTRTALISNQINEEASSTLRTLIATKQMGLESISAKKCDALLLSQLQSSDTIEAKALRCIVLVVPKDQVQGYIKGNMRNYRGDYTAYLTGPAKGPTLVKVMDSEPKEASKKFVAAIVDSRK